MRVPLRQHPGTVCDMTPGTWRATRMSGRKVAHVCCVRCGRVFTLHDRQIFPNGTVAGQAAICPWPSCAWQVWATLRGWEP